MQPMPHFHRITCYHDGHRLAAAPNVTTTISTTCPRNYSQCAKVSASKCNTPQLIPTVLSTTVGASTFAHYDSRSNRKPTYYNLLVICNLLYPRLLEIPYDEDGVHNLIGIIEPMALYTTTWGDAFPISPCPPAYLSKVDNASTGVQAHCEAKHAILVPNYALYEAAECAITKFL